MKRCDLYSNLFSKGEMQGASSWTSFRHSILILVFLIQLMIGSQPAFATVQGDTLDADMILMDDYGNIISHYTLETFQLQDGYFYYKAPPKVEGMFFDTANILELITDKGSNYRVNYFYTQAGETDHPLPDPVPLSEMPKKGTVLEEIDVWVSWIDENKRELSESQQLTYDYYWDAYEIPKPKDLRGYGYLKLQTGRYRLEGEEIPHFAFIYKKGATDSAAPSLLFGNLIEDERISTIKAEPKPTPEPPPEPEDPPEPSPGTVPGTVPGTTPPEGTQPILEPEPGYNDKPGEDPDPDEGLIETPDVDGAVTVPGTKPALSPGESSETRPNTTPSTTPEPVTVPATTPATVPTTRPVAEGPSGQKDPEPIKPDTGLDPVITQGQDIGSEDFNGGEGTGEGSGSRTVLVLSSLVIGTAAVILLFLKKR